MIKAVVPLILLFCPAFALYTPSTQTHTTVLASPLSCLQDNDISALQMNPAVPALYGARQTVAAGTFWGYNYNTETTFNSIYGVYARPLFGIGTWGVGIHGTFFDDSFADTRTGGISIAGGFKDIFFAGLGIRNPAPDDINFDVGMTAILGAKPGARGFAVRNISLFHINNLREDSRPWEYTTADGGTTTWYEPVDFHLQLANRTDFIVNSILAAGLYAGYYQIRPTTLDTDRNGYVTETEYIYDYSLDRICLGGEIRLFDILSLGGYHLIGMSSQDHNEPSLTTEFMVQFNSRRILALKNKPYDIRIRSTLDEREFYLDAAVFYTWENSVSH